MAYREKKCRPESPRDKEAKRDLRCLLVRAPACLPNALVASGRLKRPHTLLEAAKVCGRSGLEDVELLALLTVVLGLHEHGPFPEDDGVDDADGGAGLRHERVAVGAGARRRRRRPPERCADVVRGEAGRDGVEAGRGHHDGGGGGIGTVEKGLLEE